MSTTRFLMLVILTAAAIFVGVNSALADPGVRAVQPGLVKNGSPSTLTILGSDFSSGAVVSLDGAIPLVTTFVDSSTLRAELPRGFPPGIYTVHVRNLDGSGAILDAGLTVQGPEVEPTATQMPTATPEPPPPSGAMRPVIVVSGYHTNPEAVVPGQDFSLEIRLANQGQTKAANLIVTFQAESFLPRSTGGVLTVGELHPGNSQRIKQPMSSSSELRGQGIATMTVNVSYTDEAGAGYSETFTLTVTLDRPNYGPPVPTPTPTQVVVMRPQVVIRNYSTDVDILKPGTQFVLEVEVANTGNADARRVTMVAGGAALAGGEGKDAQNPGALDGAGGEFTNFSPLGTSNVQSLGDLPVGSTLKARQSLIVNVSTNPGAYSFKISFVYSDEKGSTLVDDQVITLLVYTPPVVDMSFYRDPGPLHAGQPNVIPIQIVNLGRKSVVLGNLTVTAENAELSNNTILVGSLEAGGYFTLDTTLISATAGEIELAIRVDYTDDFNQPQTIMKTLAIALVEAPPVDPGPGDDPGVDLGVGGPNSPVGENFWQKVLRFLRGVLGLDSSPPGSEPGGPAPGEGIPPPVDGQPGPAG